MSSWYPAEDPKQPYYPRTIRVQDLAPLFLTGERLEFWTSSRDAALVAWKAAINFRVSSPMKGYRPGFVTLDVTPTQDGTVGQAWFGALPPDATISAPGVGWAHIDAGWFEEQAASRVKRELVSVIAHEIGHTLGFGHGGTGIMQADPGGRVTEEEISALRAYWKT